MAASLALWRTRLICRVPLQASFRVSQHRFSTYQRYKEAKSPLGRQYWADRSRKPRSVDQHPLSRELGALGLRADPPTSSPRAVRVRVQIVSPDLCDDVIKYMGHTLEKYKGCDIIDVNPGACLWSQKLHDFLQPRTHVLLESAPSMWSTFQQPLLDEPGSTYRLFKGNAGDPETFDRLFESNILPARKPLEPQSPEAQKPNNNLLVTGTLMWEPNAKGMGFDSLGKQLPALYLQNAWNNGRYHKYGLVRSLFWMTEEDFKGAVPRSHYRYPKYAFLMNYLAKTVQVVTPKHVPRHSGHGTIGRPPQYEIQSVIRAMQSGRENGMELPEHRRDNIHDMADDIAHRNLEQGKEADARMTSEQTFQYMEQWVRDGKPGNGVAYEQLIRTISEVMAIEEDPKLDEVPKEQDQRRSSAARKELSIHKATLKQSRKISDQCEKIANLAEAIFDQECKVLEMEDGPEKEAATRELEAMNEEWETVSEATTTPIVTRAVMEANERISLKSPVTRLQWDERPYEPIVMQEDEVWPKRRACLLDTEPYPLLPGRRAKWFEWVLDFVSALFQTPNMSVIKALDTVQSGASAIVDEVPSLRDPKKGGRLNLDHLKVSMLTNEMISDLCQAYHDWPFKSNQVTHSMYFKMRAKGARGKRF